MLVEIEITWFTHFSLGLLLKAQRRQAAKANFEKASVCPHAFGSACLPSTGWGLIALSLTSWMSKPSKNECVQMKYRCPVFKKDCKLTILTVQSFLKLHQQNIFCLMTEVKMPATHLCFEAYQWARKPMDWMTTFWKIKVTFTSPYRYYHFLVLCFLKCSILQYFISYFKS